MKLFYFRLLLLLCSSQLQAQELSRPIRGDEAAFSNKVTAGFVNALPQEFKGWPVTFQKPTTYITGETRIANCEYGVDCFRNLTFRIVYDGTTVAGDDRDKFKDSLKHVTYDWHMPALVTRYNNSHQLVVYVGINESQLLGDFKYCAPKGYQTLTPPVGFDQYFVASVVSCFPRDAQKDIPDVNILTMGQVPEFLEHGNNPVKADVVFKLNTKLPSSFKVQNLVLRIQGSPALVREYLQKINIDELKKLMQL